MQNLVLKKSANENSSNRKNHTPAVPVGLVLRPCPQSSRVPATPSAVDFAPNLCVCLHGVSAGACLHVVSSDIASLRRGRRLCAIGENGFVTKYIYTPCRRGALETGVLLDLVPAAGATP